MSVPFAKLPGWVEYGVIPFVNLIIAFLISGLVVLFVGESPLKAAYLMVYGAFGYGEGLGFMLYYATNFIFAGLSVAVAFHAGLFNIGTEGQAYVSGIGVAIVCLLLDRVAPWYLTFPLAMLAGALFGALWAFVPGWLQAYRGSHVVITTIMFNYIATSLMLYMLNKVFKPVGQMALETRTFEQGAQIPKLGWLLGMFGLEIRNAPFNVTFLLALAACVAVFYLIWRTKLGYEMRTMGFQPKSAIYAGNKIRRLTVIAMLISGALAGLMSLNSIMGEQYRMQLDFIGGAGFVGIAVALMGRNHPVGIIPAAMLFGMLYQGGAEISFEMPNISRDMIVIIQGLVILFAGALEHMFRPQITQAYLAVFGRKQPQQQGA
jgi:simple sugar transport system permease protein